MSESKLPLVKKSVAKAIAKKWNEIKNLVLPEPNYIKKNLLIPSRKVRRQYKEAWTVFVCPKDKEGSICYTCTRKGVKN